MMISTNLGSTAQWFTAASQETPPSLTAYATGTTSSVVDTSTPTWVWILLGLGAAGAVAYFRSRK